MNHLRFYWLLGLSLWGSFSLHASPSSDTLPRQTLSEKFSAFQQYNRLPQVDLNTRMAFHHTLAGTTEAQSMFRVDYLRLEVCGDITDRIYYKWLQHLNRSNAPGQMDNMPSSIDCLGLGFRLTPRLSSFIGKQYADFGGFEYDASPAEVYEYSDLGNAITCFLVGANLSWWFTPNQELRLQIVDGRSGLAADTYGTLPETVRPAKVPLGYTLNWNGSFAEQRFLTRCSFSIFHEGKKQNVYFLALAAAWVQERFNMYLDAMYSVEDIDKLGLMSQLICQSEETVRVQHCEYLSLVSRLNYRLFPKWNLFVKGMYETMGIHRAYESMESGKYRTCWGYQGGIEYYPMKENLRFFALFRGKRYSCSSLGEKFQTINEHPRGFSLGLIYKIPILHSK